MINTFELVVDYLAKKLLFTLKFRDTSSVGKISDGILLVKVP